MSRVAQWLGRACVPQMGRVLCGRAGCDRWAGAHARLWGPGEYVLSGTILSPLSASPKIVKLP
eukprot:3119964-Prymnesium_polylepis.2